MNEWTEFVINSILIGVGATIVMDLWALFQRNFLGLASLDYKLVGRWIGHFQKGCFKHANIKEAPSIKGESIIGWSAHYSIGIIFAALLLLIEGSEWAQHPTFLPALTIGIVTIVAPFFIMQPGMGAGMAASKTPNPNLSRLLSLAAHTFFGIGLYIGALVVKWINI